MEGFHKMVTLPKVKKILMWALTYKCNGSCEHCFLKNYNQPYEDINKEQCFILANKIINNTDWRPEAIWLTGGEPAILDFLPELIQLFYNNDISVVLNTNSIISDDKLKNILNAKPKGIIVSLDSTSDEKICEKNRRSFSSKDILEKLKYIIKNKNSETILGTSVVLMEETIEGLYDYAKEMQKLGVEYISLNPLHSEEVNYNKIAPAFYENILKIRLENIIKLPGEFYTDFIYEYFTSQIREPYSCPALENYFFISPWGYIYPCSNEIWQGDDSNSFDMLNMNNWYNDVITLKEKRGFQSKTTRSSCFGNRCIGCWKLYYDTIFT
jgi:radical SAM protein with 4Fe4S-binding SPASM domain